MTTTSKPYGVIVASLFAPEDTSSTLRYLRKSAGLTLADVAGAVGISVSYLSDIERGRHDYALTGRIKSLFEFYGYDVRIKLQRKAQP